MDNLAIEQAKARLSKAERALEALRAAARIEEAEEAWTDFLLAASTIYAKLEQGAKGYGKSQGWFGRKKKERKDDPLLRYLHFARNSDEHGIERVAATTKDNTWQGRKLKFNERIPVKAALEDRTTGKPEKWLDAVVAGPTLRPIRVHDRRYGDHCDPPKTHMGKEISYHGFLDGLATVAIGYLRGLVAEAESLSGGASSSIAR